MAQASTQRLVSFAVAGGVLCALGCAHGGKPASSPGASTFVDRGVLGEATTRDPEELGAVPGGDPGTRVARLDRALDLFDAARLTGDPEARESLWLLLGGHGEHQGAAATREAVVRLLGEAMALSEMEAALGADAKAFVADAIMLLSADLEVPASAEDLGARALAHRELAASGHPRVADNARIRGFELVRGCLQGAIAAPLPRRMEIAVHALYAERDEIGPWLEDAAAHVRPPWPTGADLVALLDRQARAAFAGAPRWVAVAERLAPELEPLKSTVAATLPGPRPRGLLEQPRGTGSPDDLAPVVHVGEGRAVVDAGRPQQRAIAIGEGPAALGTALGATSLQDGRGMILAALDPDLPAPELAWLLQAARHAGLDGLELAIAEPSLRADTAAPVVTVLPLRLARPTSSAVGALAASPRLSFHLEGRGTRIAVDGAWLAGWASGSAALAERVAAVRRAHPREQVVGLTLGADLRATQLVAALAVLVGGPSQAFQTAAWMLDTEPEDPPAPDSERRAEERLRVRLGLSEARAPALVQPYPLREQDQRRLEGLVASLSACVPELEVGLPAGGLAVGLSFTEGRLVDVVPARRSRLPRAALSRLVECIREEATSLRLREHRDAIAIEVRFSPRSGPG